MQTQKSKAWCHGSSHILLEQTNSRVLEYMFYKAGGQIGITWGFHNSYEVVQ